MQSLRLPSTLAALLGTSTLFACDPEQDLHDDEMADTLELDDGELDDGELESEDIPSELDEPDLAAPSNEQTTEEAMSCGVWGESQVVLANKWGVGTTEFQMWAPWVGNYDFDVAFSGASLASWEIERTYYPYAIVASPSSNLGWYPFVGRTGDTFDFTMRAPQNAAPGSVHTARVRLNGSGQCTDYYVSLRIVDCTHVGSWWNNSWPTPWFDNTNCFVTGLPPGQQKFIWNNSWYVTPTNGNQCAIGWFDGANCYIGSPPGGRTAFFYNNSLYYTP
jgi:hypothetical protein